MEVSSGRRRERNLYIGRKGVTQERGIIFGGTTGVQRCGKFGGYNLGFNPLGCDSFGGKFGVVQKRGFITLLSGLF